MTQRTGLLAGHPRLLAGLWFAASFVAAQLILELAFRSWVSSLNRGGRPPAVPGSGSSLLMLAAAGAGVGAWLGAKLLDPDADTIEGVRRGAWIGIVTGIGAALIALAVVIVNPPGNRPAVSYWFSPLLIVVGALFQAGRLLPVGALAGWCLVRANRFGSKREDRG